MELSYNNEQKKQISLYVNKKTNKIDIASK
jgi:hypothetical protein